MESCYIQLSVTASGLMDMDLITHSDPYAIIYELVGEKKRMVGKTEVVMDCLAPKFAKKFELKLDINRTYLIVLFDWDYKLVETEKHDRLGEAAFTCEQLLNADRQTLTVPLQKHGQAKAKYGHVILYGEALPFKPRNKALFEIMISGSCRLDSRKKHFFLFSRETMDGSTFIPFYRSPEQRVALSDSFTFPAVELDDHLISALDDSRNITLEFYRSGWNGNHQRLCHHKLTAKEFMAMKTGDSVPFREENRRQGLLEVALQTETHGESAAQIFVLRLCHLDSAQSFRPQRMKNRAGSAPIETRGFRRKPSEPSLSP